MSGRVRAAMLCLLMAVVGSRAGADGLDPPAERWPDRRPIGRWFLARPATGWETNPRGYLNDEKLDVTTPAGRKEFERRLAEQTLNCIRNLKRMNAQGIVIWDLEGAEFKHPITYIGDPRSLPPEMDAVADKMFAAFRKAGLRVGLTVRPQQITLDGEPVALYDPDTPRRSGKVKQEIVGDPGKALAAKIAHARKRWGCTLFYIDSNWLPADSSSSYGQRQWEIMQQLVKAFPDVLLIPEWEYPSYYALSAPYHDMAYNKVFKTPDAVRERFPGAFCALAPGANTGAFEKNLQTTIDGVRQGDVMFVDAWYDSQYNRKVMEVYEEAWADSPWSEAWKDAAPGPDDDVHPGGEGDEQSGEGDEQSGEVGETPRPKTRPAPPTRPATRELTPNEQVERDVKLARSYIASGLTDKGRAMLEKIVAEHPNLDATEQAREALIELKLDEKYGR